MNITRTLITLVTGGAAVGGMQAILKRNGEKFTTIGMLMATLVGGCAGLTVADWCEKKIGLGSEKPEEVDKEEDEAE